jgi:hypothetical protein
MANIFEFYGSPQNIEYKPIIEGHKMFLLHLAACVKPEQRTQFNKHILKHGYNYENEEIIDFWNKVNLTNINHER